MKKLLKAYLETIKKFIPNKVEASSVGIDIGSGDCKLIELRRVGDAFELVNWAIEPLRNGDVSQTVKKIIDNLESPCKVLYTSVFGKGTLIRYVDMPSMSLEDLRNSFAIEADKYFPFSQDQIYTDCYILDSQGKGKQMSVLAAASKKELIDTRIKLLTELGLPADFIGINPVALVNALSALGNNGNKIDNSTVALLDMGESVSNLTIVLNKIPKFTRDIFVGGRDITKKISNVLGIGFQEAEKLKNEPAEKLKEINSACESAIMNIVQELRLSFDYFETEKNKKIDTLLLTGGGSMFLGMCDILEKNLEIKVEKWNPVASLKINPGLSSAEITKNSMKLGVALGLALYNYD